MKRISLSLLLPTLKMLRWRIDDWIGILESRDSSVAGDTSSFGPYLESGGYGRDKRSAFGPLRKLMNSSTRGAGIRVMGWDERAPFTEEQYQEIMDRLRARQLREYLGMQNVPDVVRNGPGMFATTVDMGADSDVENPSKEADEEKG